MSIGEFDDVQSGAASAAPMIPAQRGSGETGNWSRCRRPGGRSPLDTTGRCRVNPAAFDQGPAQRHLVAGTGRVIAAYTLVNFFAHRRDDTDSGMREPLRCTLRR